jgi:hypothetical protein
VSAKPTQLSLAVVGVRFANPDKSKSNRRFEIKLCSPGEPIELRPEPKNDADANAIAVFSVRGVQIGYLTAERAPRMGALIRQGREVTAVFQGEAQHGAWIRVAFDGETPVVPEQRGEAGSPDVAPDVRSDASDDGFYPDEIWPDD